MEFPAVQALIDATFNPMGPPDKGLHAVTVQSPQPVATSERGASDEAGFGPESRTDPRGSHLNEKA